jgi:hypothetical protein
MQSIEGAQRRSLTRPVSFTVSGFFAKPFMLC